MALWWIWIIPIILFLIYSLNKRKNKKWERIGNPEKIKNLLLSQSEEQIRVKRTFWLLGIFLVILSMSNIQSGQEEESTIQKGANVIIALDLSNSMNAKDIAPNRLERAKKLISDLMGKFKGDKVAFVVFAGHAYIQIPYTTDYGAIEMQLSALSTDMMPTQGTALGEAIEIAASMQSDQNDKDKIMVLLSDGEDHDSKAVETAQKASGQHVKIFTIGVGTAKGAPVPNISKAGGISYKRDIDGEQVVSKLNEDILKEISSASGGKYYNITQEGKALKEILRNVKWAKSSSGEQRIYNRYKNFYQWFLFPAIILLMLELAGVHILSFSTRKNLSILLFIAVLLGLGSCVKKDDNYKAYQAYQNKEVKNVIPLYMNLLSRDSSALNFYNLSSVYLNMGQLDSAMKYLDLTMQKKPDSLVAAQSLFNKGCIEFKNSEYKKSADSFKEGLKYMSDNYRAQYNLSLALAHLPPQDQNQQQNQDQQNQNQDPNQKDKQDPQNQKSDEDKNSKDQNSDKSKDKKDDQNQDTQKDNQQNQKNPSQEDKSQNESKPQQGQLSSKDINRLFQALDQQEKEVSKKIKNLQQDQRGNSYIEKDW